VWQEFIGEVGTFICSCCEISSECRTQKIIEVGLFFMELFKNIKGSEALLEARCIREPPTH